MVRPSAPLPAFIRVGAFDFTVELLKPMTASALRRFGEFSAMENTIRVDPNADRTKVVDTLLHEIGHAIYWAYNIDDKDDEERTVGIQASAWTQIFRDNPDLLRFLAESFWHGRLVLEDVQLGPGEFVPKHCTCGNPSGEQLSSLPPKCCDCGKPF